MLNRIKVGERVLEPEVTEAIRAAFPAEADSIIADLRWDNLNGCYTFTRWNTYIGVETDGYIHS